MKISKFRLIIVFLLFISYAALIIINFFFSPYMFWILFSFQNVVSEIFYLAAFSALFLLLPRIILATLTGGFVIFWAIYFGFFYFYNPFISEPGKLFIHPQGLYQIQHHSSWKVWITQNKLDEIEFAELEKIDPQRWNYCRNRVRIEHYFNQDHFLEINSITKQLKRKLETRLNLALDSYFIKKPDYGGILLVDEVRRFELLGLLGQIPDPERFDYLFLLHDTDPLPATCKERGLMEIAGRKAEVFYCKDAGSSSSLSSLEIRIPHQEKNAQSAS